MINCSTSFYNEPKKANHIPGNIPYVSSTATENGTDGSCGNSIGVRIFEDCITIANSGSVGACFYHPYRFIASDHVTALKKLGICADCYLSLSVLISRLGEKYNFNREINDTRLSREQIMLPILDDGSPDYDYLAKYTQHKRKKMLNKYRKYVESKILLLGDIVDIPELNKKEWNKFIIDDIFYISPGKRLESHNRTSGDRPFIGALDNNNGIADFVSDRNSSLDSNVLGVNYNGSGMCLGFYHSYECIFSDDVKRFHLKNYPDGKYVLLFLKIAIQQQKSKFGYLYKFNAERMARQKIMLPINNEGSPDYKYMEQYSKNMMLKKYKKYLKYMNEK